MDRAALEQTLADLDTFDEPRAALEQYQTPADLASRILHLADLHEDLDRPVIDLGTGTGIFAIGAALAGAPTSIGIDCDKNALSTAQTNETLVSTPIPIQWICGDASNHPLCPPVPVTIISNPPFGAQHGHDHADRAFLETIAEHATVSYTIHNEDSLPFLESFANDKDGTITRAYTATIDLPHQFSWHTTERRNQPVEVIRIEWNR